jgi:hypothetical protein
MRPAGEVLVEYQKTGLSRSIETKIDSRENRKAAESESKTGGNGPRNRECEAGTRESQ